MSAEETAIAHEEAPELTNGKTSNQPPGESPVGTRASRARSRALRKEEEEESDEEYDSSTGQNKRLRNPLAKKTATKRSKRIAFDSTDEEEESDEDSDEFSDEWDSDGSVVSEAVEMQVEDPRRIDKLFAVRKANGGSNEWFLKWRGKSHASAEWVPEEEVTEISGGKARIRNFRTSPPDPREPYFPEEFVVVDRVIAERVGDEDEDDSEGEEEEQERKEYLVKWKSLGYSDSTWEAEDTIPREQIELFHERNTPPSCKAMERLVYRKGIQPPEFRDPSLLLRPYQIVGFRWLLFSYSKNTNVILGDEMGLGKTIQSASFLYYLYQCRNNNGPFLVVSPLVTLEQWRREIESWTTMNCVLFHGSAEDRKVIIDNEFYFDGGRRRSSKSFKFNILLTTYETVIQETALLSMIKWEYMVLDEGHRIKSQSSKLLRHLNRLKLKNKIILTGTPLQNHITELWTILNFLNPSEFPSREEFLKEYGTLNATSAEKLKKGIRRFMMRRMKSDVEKSLPTKEEKIIEVELTSVQKQYYRALLDRNREFLQRGMKNKSSVTSLRNIVMELRKCSSHPYLIRGAEDRILAKSGKKGPQAVGESLILSSAKLVVLDKLLKKLREEGRHVLVFSQLKLILDILEDFLNYREYPYERLDGGVSKEDRVAAIDRFTNQKGDQFVFLLSTRAGGLGLNLTRADTVIIFDSDFNPQNDLQAMARAHRIGQTSNVVVYRLITKGTYEQKMLEIAGKKMALDTAVLGGEQGSSKDNDLGADEMDALLRYGAYHLFQENDEEEKKKDQMMQEEDINEILKRAATVVHKDEGPGSSGLSKVSFCVSEEDAEVDVNADDFWERILPEFKSLETLKQDLSEGKVNTPEEQIAFVGHLETLVEEAREDMARGKRMGEVKGVISLSFFLEEVLEALPLSEALGAKMASMLSSIQLKKRSRSTYLQEGIFFGEPETKRRKNEKPSKEKLLQVSSAKQSRGSDDEEFKGSDSEDEFKDQKLKKSKNGFWPASNLKRVRTLVNRFPLHETEKLYEFAPSVLRKGKTLPQFRELVHCCLYLAFLTQANEASPEPVLLKFGKLLKKQVSAHAGLITDFRSLGYVPQPSSSVKESKKPVGMEIVSSERHVDGIPGAPAVPPTVFSPGDLIRVRLSIPQKFYEPQKAVYLEVVGKISFSFPLEPEKAVESRFYTTRFESQRGGGKEERVFELYAPPCPGEFTMKCVKMYLKDGPRDFKHIVCGQLPFSVSVPDSLKEGLGITSRGAATLVQRGVSADVLRRCDEDPSFSLPRSQCKKPVWWWTNRDDMALLRGYHIHGFENFEEIETDEALGFALPILSARLEKAVKDLSPETQSQLRSALNERISQRAKKKGDKKGEEDTGSRREEGVLEKYCSDDLRSLRSVLSKRVQALVKAYLFKPAPSAASSSSPSSAPSPKKEKVPKKVKKEKGKENGVELGKENGKPSKESGEKSGEENGEESGKENGGKSEKENGVKISKAPKTIIKLSPC